MEFINFSKLTIGVLLSAGCASPDPPPPPHIKTVFDPLTQQLDRARDVQKTVDQNSDSTRKAVDSQERGDTPP